MYDLERKLIEGIPMGDPIDKTQSPLFVGDLGKEVYEVLAPSPFGIGAAVTYMAVGNFLPVTDDDPSRDAQLDEAFGFTALEIEPSVKRLSADQLRGLGGLPLAKAVPLNNGHKLYVVDLVAEVQKKPAITRYVNSSINLERLRFQSSRQAAFSNLH